MCSKWLRHNIGVMKFLFVSILLLELSHNHVTGDCSNFQCTYNGLTYCGLPPCSFVQCDQELVYAPGDCCHHCPVSIKKTDEGTNETKDCPYPCTQAGHHYCYPISCAMPYCVDGRTVPGECCPTCPYGPDCSAPDGHVILWKTWRMIDGKNCTCDMPPGDATCV